MLISKLNSEKIETELPIPKIDRVAIAPAIKDLTKAKIALVNTGGIVPVDNPDRIQSASATRWGRYDISNIDNLKSGVYKTIHAGFDPTVGTGTTQAEAAKMANEIVPFLQEDNVDAIIMVST